MKIRRIFKKDYNKKPTHSFDCGGRFEILGNHTDHNHGLCLAATASLAITCALSKRDDLVINLDSLGFSKIKLDLSNLEYDENENKSAAMIRGVSKYLVDNGNFKNAEDVKRAVIAHEVRVDTTYVDSAAIMIELDENDVVIGAGFPRMFRVNDVFRLFFR